MRLATTNHIMRPYILSWLGDGQLVVLKRQCLVKFVVGFYEYERYCDVFSMDVCHIILRSPRQSNRKYKHDGLANIYRSNIRVKVSHLFCSSPKARGNS